MQFSAEFFEKTWPLSGVVIGEVLQRTEGKREVGVLTTKKGKFVYKIADAWKTKEAVEKDLFIFTFLPQNGFHSFPALLKTKERKLYVENAGKLIYLLEYIDGETPKQNVETYTKLGNLTADLHLVQGYPYRTEFRPAPIIAKELESIAERLSFKNDYLALVHSLPSFDTLPETLIHTDVAPGNALEKASGDIVLVDWDDAGVGIRVLDIAFPLIQQFVSEDGEFLQEEARAFYTAYRSKISLTPEELSHVFPAALFIALMYIIYGDIEKRWERIQWALANRHVLESVL